MLRIKAKDIAFHLSYAFSRQWAYEYANQGVIRQCASAIFVYEQATNKCSIYPRKLVFCSNTGIRHFSNSSEGQKTESSTDSKHEKAESSTDSKPETERHGSSFDAKGPDASKLPEASAAPAAAAAQEVRFDSLELTDEKISALTDKIPQRPVGVVEGTSYTLLILAAFGVLAFFIYQFVVNFILEPTALTCFNITLDKLKQDPRITVRLGNASEIRAWGSNAASRVGRQQIPHHIYKDHEGTEHVRLQFHMKGPSGTALVNADMYKDKLGAWQYMYCLVDVYASGNSTPQRVHIVSPR